jgi:hypothetical protein
MEKMSIKVNKFMVPGTKQKNLIDEQTKTSSKARCLAP